MNSRGGWVRTSMMVGTLVRKSYNSRGLRTLEMPFQVACQNRQRRTIHETSLKHPVPDGIENGMIPRVVGGR